MKRYIWIIVVYVLVFSLTTISYDSVHAIKRYNNNDVATMKGELAKVRFIYAGEYQTNYVLYLDKKVSIDGEKQNRIALYITKKQWKKYKNKKLKVTGTITMNSGYYVTGYGLWDISKIKVMR